MISKEEKQAVIDLFPFLGLKPVVFDIGSNKGGFSKIILDEFKEECEIHLFEPNTMLLNYTKVEFEYNNNIRFIERAVTDGYYLEEKVPFYYFENFNNEISSLHKGEDWDDLPMKEKMVNTISVSKYVNHPNIMLQFVDLIKIDCEGSDMSVLMGCEGLMDPDRVGIIQIEYSYHYKRANRKFSEAFGLVEKYGYKIYCYKEGNFWKLNKEEFVEDFRFENFYITKYDIHNYSIGGWNNQFKMSVADLPKFDLMLELGAFEGLTTKYMCQKMLNEGGRVIVVDPLKDTYIDGDTEHPYFKNQYQRFQRNTRGLSIELYRGESNDVLPELNALRVDFCYIDGNHFAPHPYNDAVWCHAITKIGGYLLFDDYDWREETKESIDKYLDEFSDSIEVVKKDYQVLVRKTKDQYNDITCDFYK